MAFFLFYNVWKLTGDVKYDMLDIIALSIHSQICSFALVETFVLQFNVRNLQESLRRICRVFYIRPKTRKRQEKLFHASMTKLKSAKLYEMRVISENIKNTWSEVVAIFSSEINFYVSSIILVTLIIRNCIKQT